MGRRAAGRLAVPSVRPVCLAAAVLVFVSASALAAQDRISTDTTRGLQQADRCDLPPNLAPLVDDSAAFATVPDAEAAAALDAMRTCAQLNPTDGATWFRMGYLAHLHHARAERDRAMLSGGERSQLRLEADLAMARGLELAPDTARFWYLRARAAAHGRASLGDFMYRRWLDRARDLAERTMDSALLARIHVERARRAWLEYDARAHRALVLGAAADPDPAGLLTSYGPNAWDFLETLVRPVEPPTGRDQLVRMRDEIALALRYRPDFAAAWWYGYRAMLLQGAHEELLAAAAEHRRIAPDSAVPWLVTGYAAHRLARPGAAHAAFDSALVRMRELERTEWLGPGPILPDSIEQRLASMPPSPLLELADGVMRRASPFALRTVNEVRSELLARRVEAEFRFAQPELGERGMRSDRGVLLVRYGPPDLIASFPPKTRAADATEVGRVLTFWGYRSLRQGFVFMQPPMFGTARYASEYRQLARAVRQVEPFNVSQLGIPARVREATAQVVRLRGTSDVGPDSLVVLLAAGFPLGHVLGDAVTTPVPMVLGSVLTAAPAARRIAVDSAEEAISADGPSVLVRQWALTAPADVALEAARVDAFHPPTGAGASASIPLDGLGTRGVGMSDLMLATGAADLRARRWPALAPTLAVGPTSADSIVLAWELYELASDSVWRYDVEFEVRRRGGGGVLRRIGAVLGNVADLVRREADELTSDRLRVGYTRERPAPVDGAALEALTIGIGALEAGTYDIRVTIREANGRWRGTRTRSLTIAR